MDEKIEVTKLEDAFAVGVKVKDTWVVKIGTSEMIAEAFDVSLVEDRGLQARLCMDSIPDATDWKVMDCDQLEAFRRQIQESNGEIFIT